MTGGHIVKLEVLNKEMSLLCTCIQCIVSNPWDTYSGDIATDIPWFGKHRHFIIQEAKTCHSLGNAHGSYIMGYVDNTP